MDDFVTVEYLSELFRELVESGYDATKVRCGDAFIRKDEISVYPGEYVRFRGNLFNEPITEKVDTLTREIKAAIDRFYRSQKGDM